ncbi:MAG TPA: enoyl-CoA hydratase [Verrucomicrobiae bacterium]|jgi:enoyl-CoA hydratase/carnithine racemase|nr:enoyl-CoA hydratase [Verrucomicrobiae bacterium]
MADHVAAQIQERVMTVKMDRPEKKNALTRQMYMAMTAALHQAEADAAVRVIVITGTADCFTAGNDLQDFANAAPGEAPVALEYLKTLAAAKKPVIAAVTGVAIGIGTTMLLHCDLAYASTIARFQLPFVNLGLCPEAGSSLILPALAGHRRAAELLFFGEPFSAEAARALGIVNEIVPDHQLSAAVTAKAQQLAQKPPSALRATKALLKRHAAGALTEAMASESREFAALLQGPEAKEALTAFLQRRKPDFSKF